MANRRTSDDGAGGGAAALHRVLQGCNLLEYEPLLLEEGRCTYAHFAIAHLRGLVFAVPLLHVAKFSVFTRLLAVNGCGQTAMVRLYYY